MKVVGYVRVSREDLNAANQVLQIQRYCTEKGLDLVDVFNDEVSGAKSPFQREGFRRMINFCWEQGIKHILVYDLSRVSRSMTDLFELIKFFEEQDFTLMSCSQEWLNIQDATMRKLLIAVMGYAAEMERKMLINRTRAGLERAKRQGKRLGRPPRASDDAILELYKKGLGSTSIGKALGLTPSAVYKRLRRLEKAGKVIVRRR